jgi:bifunctional DNase/RNase
MTLPLHPPGLVSLPLALAAAVAALALAPDATPAARRGAPGDRVVLEVAGVLQMEDESASVVVLREKDAQTILPIIVPSEAASALDVRRRAGRSAGGSLLGRTIAALGARVVEIELDAAEDAANGATVRLAQGRRALELHARPSESVPLAIAAGVPIVARRRLLDSEGLDRNDLERLRRRADGGHDDAAETRL